MRSLDDIANDPYHASISEILVLVADPYRSYEHAHGPLGGRALEEAKKALGMKFMQAEILRNQFRENVRRAAGTHASFQQVHPTNLFELYAKLFSWQPKAFESELIRIWRIQKRRLKDGKWNPQESIDPTQYGLTNADPDLLWLSRYSHLWKHESKIGGKKHYSSFEALKGLNLDGVSVFLAANPHSINPEPHILGWGDRIKGAKSTIDKTLLKIMIEKQQSSSIDEFYSASALFGTDYAGCRIYWNPGFFNPRNNFIDHRGLPNRKKVEQSFFGDQSPWTYNSIEVYDETKTASVRSLEYVAVLSDPPSSSGISVQVQVMSLHHLMLYDFFYRNNRVIKEVRRHQDLAVFEEDRRTKSEVARMRENLTQALEYVKN